MKAFCVNLAYPSLSPSPSLSPPPSLPLRLQSLKRFFNFILHVDVVDVDVDVDFEFEVFSSFLFVF